jgi:hypothetical protein
MKGRAPKPSQAKSFIHKRVKHTNKEVIKMKMKIEERRREKMAVQDDRHFPESKIFYGKIWYRFYGVEQTSSERTFYFLKIHQSTPGSLIQEPLFLQKDYLKEQNQPLGRHQSHIPAASHQEKWIPSNPAKSLFIRERSYPIRERSFRIQEHRFLHNAKQKQQASDLILLLHPSPKSQYSQEQSQHIRRHHSHNQAAIYREKWSPSNPARSLSIREHNYPIQERSILIQVHRFLSNAKQKQSAAALIQLLHPSPESQHSPELQSQPVGLHQSHNQAANHREKWKWWTFFPHYSHPPLPSIFHQQEST